MADNGREDIKYSKVAGSEELTMEVPSTTSAAKDGHVKLERTSKIDMGDNSVSGSTKFLYIAACAGNLAAFTCGIAFGWTSPVTPKLNSTDPSINPLPTPITADDTTWIGSLLPLGAIFGPFAAGYFADKIGRKKTLLVSAVPFIIAFAMMAFAAEVKLFYVARFLCGLAVGGVFTVLPMYIGEIAIDSVRGALGSFMQLFITVGLLFSYSIGPYISILAFNIICLAIPVIFVAVFLFFIPESPYYLIAANDENAAEESLKKLRSKSSDGVQKELSNMKASVAEAQANKGSFMDIFKSKGLVKALMLSLGLVAFQQMSGINVILFYTQNIFKATGSSIPPEISTIIIGVVQVLASLLTPILVDRLGKRLLLLVSAIGMMISEGVLGYYFYILEDNQDVSAISWLPILCLVGYMIFYCVGFGPLPWAVLGELFPSNVKSIASTATASACWILGFVITKFYESMTISLGTGGTFWLFTGFCGLAAAFVFKLLPETSGKSLQEIQDILNGVTK